MPCTGSRRRARQQGDHGRRVDRRASPGRSPRWLNSAFRNGRAMAGIAPGFRRFRFQTHAVFYTKEAGFILIRAVLHQAREIKPDLFD